ncbi:MAG: hypothetical protein PVF22_06165, partial [Candidatus Aminicenantes bacterium]
KILIKKEVEMQKIRNLRLLGLAAVLTIALVIVGVHFLQAQSKIQGKGNGKGKPGGSGSKSALQAIILDVPDSSLKGTADRICEGGWLYDDSEGDVNVIAAIQTYQSKKTKIYRSRFYIEIFYPEEIYFTDSLDSIPENDAYFDYDPPEGLSYNYLGFPGLNNCSVASCIFRFLKGYHPVYGYNKVHLQFAGPSSENHEEAYYENWPIGVPIPIGCFSFVIEGQNLIGGCNDCNPQTNHNIMGTANDYGYFIRTAQDEYKVVVDKSIWGNKEVNIHERYCECVEESFNKKKTILRKKTLVPTYGTCDMTFEIFFKKSK